MSIPPDRQNVSFFGHLKRLVAGGDAAEAATSARAGHAEAAPLAPDSRRLAYRHSGVVLTAAISPDGAFLALAGGGTVDPDLRRHIVFKEHFQVVMESDIALFRVEDLLAGGDRAARPLFLQKGHTATITCLRWASDGVLWSGGGDGFVRRHDLERGLQTGAWKVANDAVLALHPLEIELSAEALAVQAEEAVRAAVASAEALAKATAHVDSIVPEAGAHGHEVDDEHAPEAEAAGRADQPLGADWFLQAAREAKAAGANTGSSGESVGAASEEAGLPAEASAQAGATHVRLIAADRIGRMVELRRGKTEARFELGKYLLVRAAFLDERRAVVTNQDGALLLLDAEAGAIVGEQRFDEPIYAIIARRDGAGYWSGDRLGRLRRHAADGAVEAEACPIAGARILSLAESPDGGRLAAGNIRGELAELDAATLEPLRTHAPLPSRATRVTYLGERLLAGDYDGSIYLL